MSFYGLATLEIQNPLPTIANKLKKIWLADDATRPGSLESLKKWCSLRKVVVINNNNNESKFWLILKNQLLLKKQEVCLVTPK